MKSRKILFILIIFIVCFISAFLNQTVQATPMSEKLYFGIAEIRTTTNMGYAMGDPDSGAEKIWKIVQYSNTSYNDPTEVSAYCIKANTGFAGAGSTDTYDVSYNMKTEKTEIAAQNDILNHLVNDGQYENLLALADLLYVKGVSTQAERQQLLDDSGANDIVEKSDFNGVPEYYITDDEIDAIQQAAIWYFTNYEENGRYDKYGETSWIWYTDGEEKGEYKNFSSYNPTNFPYTSATAGYFRQQQMVKLYQYLIDTARNNASKGINDEKTILTVYASNQDAEAQPIMEVYKVPRTFDLSFRKYITAINDEALTSSRVPVIDESTLENGTTATYTHRKDPVEVKNNDIITYNMTIYNEGEKAGRATEIVDQLPTGLEFVEVVSGNFEVQTYDEQTNTIYLTRKVNNTTNLSAYEKGNVSSETIQIKCRVTATGGESDQILTNIAWIAEEIDEDGTVITSNLGDDRDSEPSTITTQTKEDLVTTDDGYIGNDHNQGKDLMNSESYFEGQQDDDDFEKVVVRAVTSVEVSKVWEDNNNQDGIRATEITVELLKNEQSTGQTMTLNEANGWSGKFENLPIKENGQTVIYSVKETTSISGYTTNTNATTDSTGKSYTITNSHTPATINVSVNKIWSDNHNQDGIRPTTIQIALKKGTQTLQTVTLDANNNWSYIFTGLAKYENGQEIEYTVDEVSVPEGYTTNKVENSNNNFTITNTHTPTVTSITAKKEWYDFDNRDGLRPESVQFELYKNGSATGEIKTLTGPAWTVTFDNLPVKENGVDIEYTVVEVNVPQGYYPIAGSISEQSPAQNSTNDTNGETAILAGAENNYIITNIHLPFDLSLRKYITKVGDIDITNRIPNIDISELANNYGNVTTAIYKHKKNPIIVNTGDKIIYNLTIYNEGAKAGMATKIEDQLPTGLKFERLISEYYEVESYSETDNLLKLKLIDATLNAELPNNDYLLQAFSGEVLDSITIQIECTVTAEAGSTNQILTNVAWISEAYDEEDDITITTQEHADTDSEPGTKPNVTKDDLISTDNGYIGNENNSEKDLTSSEEYFEGEQDDEDFEKIVVEAKTQITVTKQWEDNNDQDRKRPGEITLTLYAGEEATEHTASVSKNGNTWTYTFSNLPKYADGEEIVYTVRETVPDGYTASDEGIADSANNYTITNSYTPETTQIVVTKKWEDNDNQDGIRPPEIQVELIKNGEETGNTVTLNEGNNWAGTFENLAVNENGEKITYTIKEITVDGYAVLITQNSENNFTITNTHTPGTTSVTVNKVWNDKDNQDGLRPDSIQVQLIGTIENDDGTTITVVDKNITITKDEGWIGTFNDLPVNEDGQEIIYTVREMTQIDGYTSEVRENTESTNNTEDTENIASTDEVKTTTVTYNARSMVRATSKNIEPKNFTITNTHIVEEEFDLALRKFMIAISKDETIEESDILRNEDGSGYAREPVVDASKLNTLDEDGNTITTAIYHHTKEPVLVKKSDIIVYMLRVYNEGEQDGYAAEITDYLPPYLTFVDGEFNEQYGWKISENGRMVTTRYLENSVIAKPETDVNGNHTLSYVEVPIMCRVSDSASTNQNITNLADITEYQDKDKQPVEDRDSKEENVEIPTDEELPSYKDEEIKNPYVPGQEDDDDFEKVIIKNFDLSLRKFITKVDEEEVTTRVPEVSYHREEEKLTYNHTKDPVEVVTGNVVEYMIRVYNEGDMAGYAQEVTDDIPNGLKFLPENATNIEYRWVMYDAEGNVTENSEEAVEIKTDYLSKEQEETEGENLLQAFKQEEEIGEGNPDYRDIKVAFEVVEPNESDRIIINSAQITDDSDENGNPVEDIDSIPDEWNEGEDDQDKEYIKLTYFDLSLRKWVTEAIVVEDGKEAVTQTGHTAEMDPEPVVKVELYRKDTNHVTVKFRYKIRITNEGDIAGYAKDITDYIPEGLKFVAEDNPEWTDKGNNIISTKQLENTLLQPGETADVEVLLTWINGEDTMGVMTNIAEISEDDNEKGAPDKDSTPDNQVPGEDDIDDASVLLAVETGQERIYYILGFTVLGTLAGGLILIKKFVI